MCPDQEADSGHLFLLLRYRCQAAGGILGCFGIPWGIAWCIPTTTGGIPGCFVIPWGIAQCIPLVLWAQLWDRLEEPGTTRQWEKGTPSLRVNPKPRCWRARLVSGGTRGGRAGSSGASAEPGTRRSIPWLLGNRCLMLHRSSLEMHADVATSGKRRRCGVPPHISCNTQ